MRGGRPLRLHDAEPGEARRQESAAASSRCAGVHAGGAKDDHGRARPRDAAAVAFAAATGLRPAEWASIERRDVDRARRVLSVRGTKTAPARRREVPLTTAALAALDESCRAARLALRVRDDPKAAVRRRQLPAAGVGAGDRSGRDREARPDLRSPLDVRVERARGRDHDVRARPDHGHVSVGMIEAHYGALIDTAHDAILTRLEAFGPRSWRTARPGVERPETA